VEEFFQTLRQIQKKERNNSSLARVGDNFYKNVNNYINELKTTVGPDPFSDKQYLLKDAQRIATEICERREHKITEAALMNIHRSYHLFKKGKPQFDFLDTTPLNLTKEEETLYFSLIDTLRDHRGNISLDKFTEVLEDKEDNIEFKSNNVKKASGESLKEINTLNEKENNKQSSDFKNSENSKNFKNDEVLDELQKIKNAKVLSDEKFEPIEKQLRKNNTNLLKNQSKNSDLNKENEIKNNKSTQQENSNLSDILNRIDNQFVDFNEETQEEYNNYSKNINQNSINDTLLIFKDVEPIIGVDEKVYGPFFSQDIVVMPRDNAKIFVKYRKARLIKIP